MNLTRLPAPGHPWRHVRLSVKQFSALRIAAVVGVTALLPSLVQALPPECGSLRTHYGPFDYTKDRSKLGIVENYHFMPEVEALIPSKLYSLGGSFDYTLKAFPNHHRALAALSNYGLRLKSEQPERTTYTITCFFERAIAFKQDDLIVRMLYASYLGKTNRSAAAEQQLQVVVAQDPQSPLTLHNLGLLYFALARYDRALEFAHKAMAKGFIRTDLMDLLKSKGQWKDPPMDAVPSESAASVPAASSAAVR